MIGAENAKPRLTAFIGSSSESQGIAEAILENLEGKVEITCWYHDFYKPTSSVFDDLLEQIGGFDFGIFIFAPDDVVEIRQHSAGSVRDNVLFELGLFLGILGKERVFIVAHPDFHGMRVPTDLHGRNFVPFHNREDGNLVAALGTACRKLHDAMKDAGPKPKAPKVTATRGQVESAGPPELTPLDQIIAEMQIGRASFVVINDDIRKANTEIIVSSDDNHFTARGGVSKAILAKVGPDVRRQLDYYGRQQFRQGQIVVTTAGDWNRRAVIHAAVIDLDENRYPTIDVIHDLTRRILDCAVALGARSIALPVLGGGYATKFLRSSDSVNAIAAEIIAFMGGGHDVGEGLKRIALYIFDRADAGGLPKELLENASTLMNTFREEQPSSAIIKQLNRPFEYDHVPMKLDHLCAVWPHSYHVTSGVNLASIRNSRVLWPARTLLERANRAHLVRRRRSKDLLLRIESSQVLIRNQIPLNPSLLDLPSTCTLEEYIACLNSYVFFWPGTAIGPSDDGVRMFERTKGTRAIVFRARTESLVATNVASPKYVATCNTGVTWTERGIKARRGPEVFQCLDEFSDQSVHIRELCFKGEIRLPDSVEFADSPTGPWSTLL